MRFSKVSFLNTWVSFQYTTPQNHPKFPFLRGETAFGTEIALKGSNKKMVQFGTARMFVDQPI